MKKIFALILSLSAFSALAGEIKLYDRPTYETSQISSIREAFEINPQLGRAWVNMKFDEVGDGPVYYDQRVQVADTFNQVQVNPQIGLTFAECIRSFLRQDPDIIMVGEIRDFETGWRFKVHSPVT